MNIRIRWRTIIMMLITLMATVMIAMIMMRTTMKIPPAGDCWPNPARAARAGGRGSSSTAWRHYRYVTLHYVTLRYIVITIRCHHHFHHQALQLIVSVCDNSIKLSNNFFAEQLHNNFSFLSLVNQLETAEGTDSPVERSFVSCSVAMQVFDGSSFPRQACKVFISRSFS